MEIVKTAKKKKYRPEDGYSDYVNRALARWRAQTKVAWPYMQPEATKMWCDLIGEERRRGRGR